MMGSHRLTELTLREACNTSTADRGFLSCRVPVEKLASQRYDSAHASDSGTKGQGPPVAWVKTPENLLALAHGSYYGVKKKVRLMELPTMG